MFERVECPVEAYNCPYFRGGWCYMKKMEGRGPEGECEDYDAFLEDGADNDESEEEEE